MRTGKVYNERKHAEICQRWCVFLAEDVPCTYFGNSFRSTVTMAGWQMSTCKHKTRHLSRPIHLIILYSCLIAQITEKKICYCFGRKDYIKSNSGSNRRKKNLAKLSISLQSLGRFALQFPNRSLNFVFTLFFHYYPCLTDVNSANELSVLSVTQGNFKIWQLEYVGIHLCLHIFLKEKFISMS